MKDEEEGKVQEQRETDIGTKDKSRDKIKAIGRYTERKE